MSGTLPIRRCALHSLAIPLRRKVTHAASERIGAEPLIFEIELANGTVGFGETLPREYVSGESIESVKRTIADVFVPLLLEARPESFGEVIELAAELPTIDQSGKPITAARAAVELAILDGYSRAFGTSLESLAGYFEELWLEPPGSRNTVRYTVVIPSVSPDKARKLVRLTRLAGIQNYKLKIGDSADQARLDAVLSVIGKHLESKKCSLMLDANGAWSPEQARERLSALSKLPVLAVEQPLPRGDIVAFAELASHHLLPLMPDESLVTQTDADELIDAKAVEWFNIRLSKNGGLIPAIQLAIKARKAGLNIQLGCMVGETSILSAAGRWFLQMVPGVARCEGSFGRFLMGGDVVRKPIRFGLGGKWRPQSGYGLGIDVIPELLHRWSITEPSRYEF